MSKDQRKRIEALKIRLASTSNPIMRIALYNDPANGTIAERVIAIIESESLKPR